MDKLVDFITTILGKVGILLKEEYDIKKVYERLDVVTFEGSSYIAKKPSVGVPLDDEEYWMCLAKAGKTPKKGEDYLTPEEKEQFEKDITQVVEENLDRYIDENTKIDIDKYEKTKEDELDDYTTAKKQELEKTNETVTENFNTNATNKINTFNENAKSKQEEFDEHVSEKIKEFNNNAQTETDNFNTNSTTKTTEFDTNATNKTNAFNTNATKKTETFNNNATEKTKDFDSNVQTKTENFNTNATNKINTFNENAKSKQEEFDEHVSEYSERLENIEETTEDINERVKIIEKKTGNVYGVRRKITNNSSPEWERILDGSEKIATATKDGSIVQNDFDELIPWSEINSCNYDLNTNKINAWFGDPSFKFDGTNGDVFTYYPKTYWKIYQEDDYDYVLLADHPKAGFTEIDSFFIGRYPGSVVDNVLHTYSGLVPTTNRTIGAFRTLANALGDNFSQLDWRYFVLQMLYLVEYANYNSQSMLGNGVQSRKYLKTLIAENNTNRVVIGSASGYYVGQIIRIGTSDGGTQIADARKITAIEAYDDGTVTGSALTFDGAAVNIAVDNFVCTMAQETGQCDTLGMKSGCLNNDSYHSMIYRGVENLFSNIWQWVDGINVKDHLAYICKDHSQYASDKFTDPYKPLAYTNAEANGYAKTLGLDVDEPFFRFPTEVGGSTSTYMADYYYQNTGNRVALVGGAFYNGARDGLWYWGFDVASSIANWNVGCRVLIDNQ